MKKFFNSKLSVFVIFALLVATTMGWAGMVQQRHLALLASINRCYSPGNDANTKLLIRGTEIVAASDFTESGQTGHTMSFVGTQSDFSSAQAYFGTKSMLFDGTDDLITAPNHADWNLTGIWTYDAWIYLTATANNMALIGQWETNGDERGWYVTVGNDLMRLSYSTDGTAGTAVTLSVAWSPSTSTWYHVVFVRNTNDLMFFVNGTQRGATQDITGVTFNDSETLLTLGAVSSVSGPGNDLTGYQDMARFSPGVARWTTTFDPPTFPYCN